MSWFNKLFGRERQESVTTTTEETEDGARTTSVSFTLDGDNMRTVRDDVVEAIDDALAKHDEDVLHLIDPSRMMRWEAGGPPVWSIATIRVDGPEPYWLWVTYGFSGTLSPVDYREAYKHEYAIAVRCDGATERPMWPAIVLRQMTHYVLDSGAELCVGDNIPCNMPITHLGIPPDARAEQPQTELEGLLVGVDPLIPSVSTPHGEIEVRRLVGIHPEELGLVRRWNGKSLWQEVERSMPDLTCALGRPSLLGDTDFAQRTEARVAEEGSSLGVLFVQGGFQQDGDAVVLSLPGGPDAKMVAEVLKARLPFDRPLILRGPPEYGPVVFEPADEFAMALDEDGFVVQGQLDHPAYQAIITSLESDAPRITIRFGG